MWNVAYTIVAGQDLSSQQYKFVNASGVPRPPIRSVRRQPERQRATIFRDEVRLLPALLSEAVVGDFMAIERDLGHGPSDPEGAPRSS
jgi:hypothetical protein